MQIIFPWRLIYPPDTYTGKHQYAPMNNGRRQPFNLCPMSALNINHQTEKQVQQDTDKSVEENQFVRSR